MPRLERKTRQRRGWPDGAVLHLRTGHDLLGIGLGRDVDEATLRAAWTDLREEVMAQSAAHHRLGCPSRPWAWWQFEFPTLNIDVPAWCRLTDDLHAATLLHVAGLLNEDESRRLRAAVSERWARMKWKPEEAERLRPLLAVLGIEGSAR